MKIVGLTGGIGSGKTTVAKMFATLGVPIYIADFEAKRLTNTSKVIRRKLIALLGEEAYKDDLINRSFVADKIFNDMKLLEQVNRIIHPKVAKHFARWVKKQDAIYCIKEAAILFENGGYENCDLTILVTAPLKERVRRVLERDNTTREAIEARMANQWSDSKKEKLANIIIVNNDLAATRRTVNEVHKKIVSGS